MAIQDFMVMPKQLQGADNSLSSLLHHTRNFMENMLDFLQLKEFDNFQSCWLHNKDQGKNIPTSRRKDLPRKAVTVLSWCPKNGLEPDDPEYWQLRLFLEPGNWIFFTWKNRYSRKKRSINYVDIFWGWLKLLRVNKKISTIIHIHHILSDISFWLWTILTQKVWEVKV